MMDLAGTENRQPDRDGTVQPVGIVAFPVAALVLSYVTARRKRGTLSSDTAARVRRRLSVFASAMPPDVKKINRQHIEHWLERPDLAPGSLAVMFSDVRGFFKWCVIEGHVRKDPTLAVEPPHRTDSVPGALSMDSDELLRAAMREMDPRLRVIFSLERFEALRRVEVARMQVGDIDLRGRVVKVRGKARGGRGDITRSVPLSDETVCALRSYFASEPGVLGIRQLASGPLIRNRWRPSAGITPSAIGDMVAKELYRVGVKHAPRDRVSGHALRHTAATEAVELGVPDKIVQTFLGHQDAASTAIYTKGAVRDLRQIHEARRGLAENETLDLRSPSI